MEDMWYDDVYDEDEFDEDFYEDGTTWDEEGSPYGSLDGLSAYEMLHACVLPTTADIAFQLGKLLLSCCMLRGCVTLGVFPPVLLNLITVASGIWISHQFFKTQIVYLLLFCVLVYAVIWANQRFLKQGNGILTVSVTVAYLVVCELLIADETSWHKIRGAQMILSMKVISLGFDLDGKQVACLPSLLDFASYCLSPSTAIFGPWTNYNDHVRILSRTSIEKLWWIVKFLADFVLALIFLSLSTCWTHWLFSKDSYQESSKWTTAYGDALSFRSSHYFVSYISEATAVMAGFSMDLRVTEPHYIEVPRSLVEVVIHWNIPMHYWLKTYVFKVARPYGTFTAIFATYAASSFLHGLNFQLTAVLLSLGFYTYVEYELRQKLASIFHACILTKRCKKECHHVYKQNHPGVVATNLTFGLLTLFHLTYLGLMFDSAPSMEEKGYDMMHTLGKWGELNYASHWVALATLVFHLLL